LNAFCFGFLARQATIRGRPADAGLAARNAKSAQLFIAFQAWLQQIQARISGKSELAKAIRCTLSRWHALTLALRDGRACIDNNAAERSMWPMAIGGSLCIPSSKYLGTLEAWPRQQYDTGDLFGRRPF
jgi:hypothetical protein